jgi:hypothetical protein
MSLAVVESNASKLKGNAISASGAIYEYALAEMRLQ